jgi:hypothetical protein
VPVEFTSLSVYFCIREAKIQRNKKTFMVYLFTGVQLPRQNAR